MNGGIFSMSVTLTKPPKLSAHAVRPEPAMRHLSGLLEFGAICFQLLLLFVLVKRYNLESPIFVKLTALTFTGFAVHYFLPLKHRLTFFLFLSLASVVLVLGVAQGAWLVLIGLALVGLCHVPLPYWIRVALVAAAGGALALMRGGRISNDVPAAVWPILGSMFAFRMIVYLYDLYHGRAPKSVSQSLSYFFMLPNVCFPLFPLVDFQAFRDRYFNANEIGIYQVGVRWIFRGIVHLILYRIVYSGWSIGLNDVKNAGDFVHYCVWTYLLYLRVSGQFHIIAGMLHLFGFNLPETHHLYYLSNSFIDFYRRINIYWKDFMMKVFFYPAYFRLKSFGPQVALVVSTLVVFLATWVLHAVQWYWLRGTRLMDGHDMLFWGILASLVIANSLWDLKRAPQRTASLDRVSWSDALRNGFKTLATFTVICLLWSMWSSKSLAAWINVWQYLRVGPTAEGWFVIVGTVLAIGGGGALVARYPRGFAWSKLSFMRESALRSACIIAIAGVSISAVNHRLGAFGVMMDTAKTSNLNPVELEEMERGYYENLNDVPRFNGELWRLYTQKPLGWNNDIVDAGFAQSTNNFLQFELKPSTHGKFKGVPFDTNHWGMHDSEYTQKRPAGCYRIAMLGASHAMGSGVEEDADFETLIENRLNRDNTGKPYSKYEILNFAVENYNPMKQIWVLEEKALAFEPNAMIYVGHAGDDKRAARQLAKLVHDGVDPHYPYLRDLVQQAKATHDMPESEIARRIGPLAEELMTWTFRRLAETCRAHNIRPTYILLPQLGLSVDPEPQLKMAREAGFSVLNVSDVYNGYDPKSLWASEWDSHPNARGHQMLAQRIFDMLREQQIVPIDAKPAKE
jgi:hypothetical protein